MEHKLKTIIASHQIPFDLAITYDDRHGLWGGSILSLQGDGRLERQTTLAGAATAEITQTSIDKHKIIELVRLLVELTAWEQQTPDSLPVAGESRAQLTISLGGSTSRMWERFNEMPANNRLIQIKTWMESV